MKINPTIFREYDIRGVAGIKFSEQEIRLYEKWYGPFPGVTITLDVARAIGKGFGTDIRRRGGKEILVGHEMRPFADELTNAFISGIRSTGCNVTDLGVSLTPIVYFTVIHKSFDGGVNVTGSHNVYFFNGFKIMEKNARPIAGEELQKIREMVEKEEWISDKEGTYRSADGYPAYKEYMLDHIKLSRAFRVVIDCGNGSAGMFAPDLFRSLGCEVIELYTDPDARFPNHTPDPQYSQYCADLEKKVLEAHADLGIGFDADGDRVGFVNEQGKFVEADLTMLVFAKDVLSRFPGKKILYTVKSSQLPAELVPKYGGVPVMHRHGHAPIKETLLRDPGVVFAAEDTAHFFFAEDYFKIDDGLFAAAKLLEMMDRRQVPFSSLLEGIPERVRTPEIKLPCADEKKTEIVARICENLRGRFPSVLLDGIRIQVSETGWGLIRQSNTAPYLSVRAEGASEAEVLKIKNILADELEKFPAIMDRLNRSAVATLTGKLG